MDAKTGISIDDLGPSRPIIEYDPLNKKLNITIPTKNQDGSNITEEEIKIKVRLLPGKNCEDLTDYNKDIMPVAANDITKGKPGEKIPDITFNQPAGCYAFTAEDEKGNIKTEELKKMEKQEQEKYIITIPVQ